MITCTFFDAMMPDIRVLHFTGHLYYKEDLQHALPGSESMTDTDLVWLAYDRWGKEFANHLEGDFACVLYDPKARLLLAARSLFGAKPLFWIRHRSQVSFTSDVLVLMKHDTSYKNHLDACWIARYVTSGRALRGTIFRNIQEIEAGSTTLVSEHGATIVTKNTITPADIYYSSPQEYREHFHSLLTEGVRQRVTGHSKVMADVSGGLDSSTIAAIASLHTNVYGIHGGTQRHIEHDGHVYAEAVAKKYAFPLRTIWYEHEAPAYSDVTGPAWCAIPSTPAIQFKRYYQLAIAEAERVDAHIWLRGDGGDALHLINYRYLYTAWQERRYAYFAKEVGIWIAHSRFKEAILHGIVFPSRAQKKKNHQGSLKAIAPWLDEQIWRCAFDLDEQEEKAASLYLPSQRALQYYVHLNADHIAFDQSFLTDHHLDIINPYNDPRLFRYMLAVPAPLQLHPAWKKHFLREATKGILPEEVRLRRSKGTIARVLLQDLMQAPHIMDRLCDNMPVEIPGINWMIFAQEVRRVVMGGPVYEPAFFSTLTLALWLKQCM